MTQQVGQGEQTITLTRFCTSCGERVEVAARFCGTCGHPVDTTGSPLVVAASPAPIEHEVAEQDPRRGRRGLWLAGGIGLAVLLASSGVGAVLLAQPQPEDDVLANSAAETVSVLESMAAAQTTAELRDTAAAADSAADPGTRILPSLSPTDPTALALASIEEVLGAAS